MLTIIHSNWGPRGSTKPGGTGHTQKLTNNSAQTGTLSLGSWDSANGWTMIPLSLLIKGVIAFFRGTQKRWRQSVGFTTKLAIPWGGSGTWAHLDNCYGSKHYFLSATEKPSHIPRVKSHTMSDMHLGLPPMGQEQGITDTSQRTECVCNRTYA